MKSPRVVVVGGGAAGFFAAIRCAQANPACQVTLLEATAHLLAKVKISGGGRCNVTHACFEPRELVKRYPRGGRELIGAFHRWQPRDTVAWFEAQGVQLKTEEDGRMFPVTDDSQTVVDCLLRVARQAGVNVRTQCGLADVALGNDDSRFQLLLVSGEKLTCDRLLLATGGNKSSVGLVIAKKLGHSIEPPVPSLFTFNVDDPRLRGLAGLSVAEVETSVRDSKLRERGPVLVTHWGVSGPGILKLSAWGARELHQREYRFILAVNWLAGKSLEEAKSMLASARQMSPRRQLATASPFEMIPQRLWERLVVAAQLSPEAVWTSVSNEKLAVLAAQLTATELSVNGKSTNKDEFVTCGGVRLSEVDFKTMESQICPRLYFAGELLDIDGVTGGFNFQSAWTTGHLAGSAMAAV